MRLANWLMDRLPLWLRPTTPWGPRRRAPMPEMHAEINDLQALRLRADYILRRREQREAEERRRYHEWRGHDYG